MRRLGIIVSVFLAASCAGSPEKSFSPLPFPHVSIPGAYADDIETAVEYALMHYWDALTDTARAYPCDSSLVSGVLREKVEQAFADYSALLVAADAATAGRSVRRMADRAVACERADTSSNVLETLAEIAEHYLYDPNSPLRYEDMWGICALDFSRYEGFAPEKRALYEYQARMCALNAVGTPAADFSFSDAGGKIRTLYGIDAEYTLLFFSNPGCEACRNIIETIKRIPGSDELTADGTLAVVNVYIDEDIPAWYDYVRHYPSEWYNGYDHNGIIRSDTLYDVRAIPSLYLLDRDKKVLLKDAPENNVFAFLANLSE